MMAFSGVTFNVKNAVFEDPHHTAARATTKCSTEAERRATCPTLLPAALPLCISWSSDGLAEPRSWPTATVALAGEARSYPFL